MPAKFQGIGRIFAIYTVKGHVPLINDGKFRLACLTQLRETSKVATDLLDKTTETWKRRPRFRVVDKHLPGAFRDTIGVDLDTDSLVWFWLDQGTKKRLMEMSDPYIRKTEPRQFFSYAGRGGTRRWAWPEGKGPIEARHWSNIMWELMSKDMAHDLRKIIFDMGSMRMDAIELWPVGPASGGTYNPVTVFGPRQGIYGTGLDRYFKRRPK